MQRLYAIQTGPLDEPTGGYYTTDGLYPVLFLSVESTRFAISRAADERIVELVPVLVPVPVRDDADADAAALRVRVAILEARNATLTQAASLTRSVSERLRAELKAARAPGWVDAEPGPG